ncbi:hypothetical protein Hanom_Chr11g01045221 [Helianthus anomalus]
MKLASFQTFWIQMRKNKPLNGSRKTGSGTKMAFYSKKTKMYFDVIALNAWVFHAKFKAKGEIYINFKK